MRLDWRAGLLWLLFFLLMACGGSGRPAGPPTAGAVNGPEAYALMNTLGEKLLVLDVRTPQEFSSGHAPGALLIPLAELKNRLGELPADRPLLIVCRTGRRAAQAYELLLKERPAGWPAGLWYLQASPRYEAGGGFSFL